MILVECIMRMKENYNVDTEHTCTLLVWRNLHNREGKQPISSPVLLACLKRLNKSAGKVALWEEYLSC